MKSVIRVAEGSFHSEPKVGPITAPARKQS